MPISTVKKLCNPSDVVTIDSVVEQVAQIVDFASGRVDGREFFRRNYFTAGLMLLVARGFERLAAERANGGPLLTAVDVEEIAARDEIDAAPSSVAIAASERRRERAGSVDWGG